jgi:hypothetical protein
MLGRPLLLVLLVGGALVPRAARALDEGEWQLGLGATVAAAVGGLSGNQVPVAGGGPRLDGRRGLTDALSAWVAVGAIWIAEGGDAGRLTTISTGLALAFDVVRVVPYVELGAAGFQFRQDTVNRYGIGLVAAGGFDYLLDRRWSVGAALRAEAVLSGHDGDTPLVLPSLGVRLARSF